MIPSTVATMPSEAVLMNGSPLARFSRKAALPSDILLAVLKNAVSSRSLTVPRLPSNLTIISESLGATKADVSAKGSPLARFSRKADAPKDILLAVSRNVLSSRSLTSLKPLMRYTIPSTVATMPSEAVLMKGSPLARFSKKRKEPVDILSAVVKKPMSSRFLTPPKLFNKLIIISDSLGVTNPAFSANSSPLLKFSRKVELPAAILSTVSRKDVSFRSLTLPSPLII